MAAPTALLTGFRALPTLVVASGFPLDPTPPLGPALDSGAILGGHCIVLGLAF